MKASYQWIRALVPGLTATAAELAARFTAAGLEVEAMHEYGAGSAACLVATVVSQRPHPTKSGLSLVTVDRRGLTLELVCGAPNVPEPGGLVVLAPLGARLPGGVTIERRTIAGVVSEGMLCSESELGLSDGVESKAAGILVLAAGAAKPGAHLAEAIPESHDTIFDINLTPNRPDGLGHIGLAREAAALYGLAWTPPGTVPQGGGPPSRAPVSDRIRQLAHVRIDDPERCPEFQVAAVTGVTVAPSPPWLRYRLTALGLRPISNVVDVTNLVLLEYGHPMHAYDLDRLHGVQTEDTVKSLIVRRASEGESLVTLDGVTHTLTTDDLVIADGQGAVGLAGVMGGVSSEITAKTTNLLLECAFFEPRGVRRSSRRHALHTDASHRFERGVDRHDAYQALARASSLLAQVAGGSVVPGVIHAIAQPPVLVVASLRSRRLDQLLGVHVPWDEAVAILERLGFHVRGRSDSEVEVIVPSHRPDVTREVDLIEEIARVRGMDAIPCVLPRVRPSREEAPRETICRRVRGVAVELGLSEAVTYSFVSRGALTKVSAPPPSIVLKNPLSVEQEVMRTSLLPGLLDVLSHARRHGERDVRMFTVGSVFLGASGEHGLPEEQLRFTAILAGERDGYLAKPEPVDVWDAKGLAEGLVLRILGDVAIERVDGPALSLPAHLHPRGAARITSFGVPLGTLGPLHPDVVDRFDLGGGVFVVELDLSAFPMDRAREHVRFSPLPRFPPSPRDLSVLVPTGVMAGDVLEAVRRVAGGLASDVKVFDRFTGEGVPDDHQSLAFRIVYRTESHTLTDADVDAQHAKVVAAVRAQFGATLRK